MVKGRGTREKTMETLIYHILHESVHSFLSKLALAMPTANPSPLLVLLVLNSKITVTKRKEK